ncbi:nitronate monooxygenase [Bradyrhizobium sp. U87765 SZCCT0131]|uniref:NAD(P)H-dependent flavin oxidoreductase n=1 Tax=unclassified Bradyrhizobium TaxID=2631580 RepID=UPI001BA8871B|nr:MULTISPECIES: nitronate monooxygenase [unclassified Bradyrhizobium]MBR1221103.1 nitronate monooxygenase [Bradyrhizobium sp. U87765 SZCCT0131]MBR1260077.1 nitronate monooxygenase [Bradyrhizobium sp. U87765 SZCCT0134]MBR1307674.1 nitronate monooxygenase [Bradyrhizobium sp. U87765 SZCCT0110]MBR1321628.1 nitronate monooxygenase [Bradyrhizobium sp. U87765 SZCCT0109]MBR1349941.1 nitronate monooxygenase [Bradyrhizobium sp. U87765 SZCCT0048]
MTALHHARARAEAFAHSLGLRVPILLGPMAGACPPSLSIAVGNAGGLGSAGVLLMTPEAIKAWAAEVRSGTNGAFNLNLWIPDPAPRRDAAAEAAVREFLKGFGPEVKPEAADATPPDFAAQCEAMLEAAPAFISSVMGLYPPEFVARMKAKGIKWIANISSVTEAKAAEAAGADIIAAQGMEAGGHRGAFDAATAEANMIGLFSLLPAVVDAVKLPVVATGGIGDARGVAAALLLGASAVQIGSGFLRCPEAKIAPAWADALGRTLPEQTRISRVFSGRPGRSIATAYVQAATAPGAPNPAPYPVQRGLTQAMRDAAVKADNIDGIQAWAGQSSAMARAVPAAEVVRDLWEGASALLG